MPRRPKAPASDSLAVMDRLVIHFGDLEDPRSSRTRRHELLHILTMSLCGAICGADGWEALEEFAESKSEWFEELFDLPHGTPSADTFRRVLCALDTEQFEQCFRAWINDVAGSFKGQVVALDGKSLRGAIERAGSTTPLHLVQAWVSEQRLMLGQRVAAGGASGEPAAMVAILKLFDLKGAVVTADANGCTAAVISAVRAAGADFVVALKGNRGPQHKHVQNAFATADSKSLSISTTTNAGHGRQEARIVYALPASDWQWPEWPAVKSFVMIERVRRTSEDESTETSFYLSSLPPNAAVLADKIRKHWSIENQLHWVLDVAFGEDAQRIRDARGAQNFALINRLALMLLRNEPTKKKGAPTKRKRAGWDINYLIRVFTCGLTPPA